MIISGCSYSDRIMVYIHPQAPKKCGMPQPYIRYWNGSFEALSTDCWNEIFQELTPKQLRKLAKIMIDDAKRMERDDEVLS